MRLQGADDDFDFDDEDEDCSIHDDSDVDEDLDKLNEKVGEDGTKNDDVKADESLPCDKLTENEKSSITKPDHGKGRCNENETVELENDLNAGSAKEFKASAQRGEMSQDELVTETVIKDEVDMSKLELGDIKDI